MNFEKVNNKEDLILFLNNLKLVLSMNFVGKIPLLTISGILGLSGTSYFVYRFVSLEMDKPK
jgi:hypothetical protein